MNVVRRARPLLGTLVEIRIDGPAAGETAHALERAFAVVARVHALMSYHDPTSELSRVNRHAHRTPVPVSEHTWNVLVAAQSMAERSDGLFDVTVAPLLTRWGFLPRRADLPQADPQADWRSIELLPGRRVRLVRPARLDLGGIAKGYAVDRAVETLQRCGARAGRVDAGGDLRIFGAKCEPLYVRHPRHPTRLLQLLHWTGAAATSCDCYSRAHHAGRKVNPLVHARTGGCAHSDRSVTVLAGECMYADALTKVVHADPARATALLASFGARAIVVESAHDSDACRVFDSAMGAAPPSALDPHGLARAG